MLYIYHKRHFMIALLSGRKIEMSSMQRGFYLPMSVRLMRDGQHDISFFGGFFLSPTGG
jgi:hypothetical protein